MAKGELLPARERGSIASIPVSVCNGLEGGFLRADANFMRPEG